MEIKFNLNGSARKPLVKAIGEILEVASKYLGAPTMAYQIGNYSITRDGALVFDESTDEKEVKELLTTLADLGFAAEKTECVEETDNTETADSLTLEIPLENVNVGNLKKLIEAKGRLIKKALGIDELPIEIGEDRVSFHWFSELPNADAANAYTHFIGALCEMSKNVKRVTAVEKEVDNEKYTFRCFLLRLGFIGAEYKTERKILLKNLMGSSAFKNGGVVDENSD